MADWSTLDALGMTHQPEQPNPVPGIIQPARDFLKGGLSEVLKGQGVQLPEWSDTLGGILQSHAANTAMGTIAPLKGFGALYALPGVQKYADALIYNKITPPEFEGFMEALGIDKAHIPGLRDETLRRGNELRQAVRDELIGMRDEGILRGPEERAQEARSKFSVVPDAPLQQPTKPIAAIGLAASKAVPLAMEGQMIRPAADIHPDVRRGLIDSLYGGAAAERDMSQLSEIGKSIHQMEQEHRLVLVRDAAERKRMGLPDLPSSAAKNPLDFSSLKPE